MGPRKKSIVVSRRIWRITKAAPQGEIVEIGVPKPAPVARAGEDAPGEAGWVVSSYDLLNGLEVSDNPDTLPGELFDALFHKP